MILQALCNYYHRQSAESPSALAPAGFEFKAIPFVLEITPDGKLVCIDDTRDDADRKKRAQQECVPLAVKKTSAVAANLLWDNAEYVLGIDTRSNPRRVKEQHQEFVNRIQDIARKTDDQGIAATLRFLEKLKLDDLKQQSCWLELMQNNPLMTFRIHGESRLVCQSKAVREAMEHLRDDADIGKSTCLLTGDKANIERLHPAIKGVWGSQSVGANVVSFNLDAFTSYGKKQGFNAPIGRESTFAYVTALNHLLGRGSRQRMQLGDTSTIFWAENEHPLEKRFALLSGMADENGDGYTHTNSAISSLIHSLNGRYKQRDGRDEADCRFYVLGLAPNVARLSVRFWYAGTVKEVSQRICDHYEYLKIDHMDYEPEFLPFWLLLKSIALMGKIENIPPNLAGEMIRSILEGQPYPQTIFSSVIRRIRAEKGKRDLNIGKPLPGVDYPRAALIKAYLNRLNPEENLTSSLDTHNPGKAYRLGRLFALLEYIQEDAGTTQHNLVVKNHYGIASGTPLIAFPLLMKLTSHIRHRNSHNTLNLEAMLNEIMSGINDFPSSLQLLDQGRFAIGYYHQRHYLSTHSGSSHEQT